jgi:hypothetical protein
MVDRKKKHGNKLKIIVIARLRLNLETAKVLYENLKRETKKSVAEQHISLE